MVCGHATVDILDREDAAEALGCELMLACTPLSPYVLQYNLLSEKVKVAIEPQLLQGEARCATPSPNHSDPYPARQCFWGCIKFSMLCLPARLMYQAKRTVSASTEVELAVQRWLQ